MPLDQRKDGREGVRGEWEVDDGGQNEKVWSILDGLYQEHHLFLQKVPGIPDPDWLWDRWGEGSSTCMVTMQTR